jgi:hypothetical protein
VQMHEHRMHKPNDFPLCVVCFRRLAKHRLFTKTELYPGRYEVVWQGDTHQ